MEHLPCAPEVLPGACRKVVADGSLVVAYEGRSRMRTLTVRVGETTRTQHGDFDHSGWIGSRFGKKAFVASKCGMKRRREDEGRVGQGVARTQDGGESNKDMETSRRAWIYLLSPTPELWTRTLAHRTQVLYVADISLAISRLGLKPGMHVLESGTGSGSMTHSLARAVAPSGRVDSYEFHEGRAEAAREEIHAHGLSGFVSVMVRDVQKEGFPLDEKCRADAVFLDLPGPWEAIPSLAKCLKEDGMLCSFSPCIEQVQKTCVAMANSEAFSDFRTFEVLLRNYDVITHRTRTCRKTSLEPGTGDPEVVNVVCKPQMEAKGHTGYLLFARRVFDQEGL